MNSITNQNINKNFLRNVPSWENAPVPICMGGDLRALTFCCKPGSSLTFGYKCLRDTKLKEIGMSAHEFINIKEKFSEKHKWFDDGCCFGSLAYCCMRKSGCNRRDPALKRRYPRMSKEEALAEYFRLKKELASIILNNAQNPLAGKK
ncbi:methanogenesis marker 9 domain-containing protein [Promethearchaeum syntrophicum]|uniref:Methanogenesis marker 9 domain-containing protein n=1 Tax=Promethearchaeum syntrophicum TaxID=2594042 RepID=A0A5B9DBV9_9ARCH|nr:methanogenesis marker 9 domain-containing protein [Candidatus Prometheoarchaeum syntrophicum]QEE16521.1 hypothetical protein DSAG12_02351 [Candidatus Prometheoarchaeum syntrophicum]